MARSPLIAATGLVALLLAACMPGTAPLPFTTPGPDEVARQAFEQWRRSAGAHRGLQVRVLAQSEEQARVQLIAEFSQGSWWAEREAEATAYRVGYDWRVPAQFTFRDTPKAQATGTVIAATAAAVRATQQAATQTAQAEQRQQTATAQAIVQATAAAQATQAVQATQTAVSLARTSTAVALATLSAVQTATRAADPAYLRPLVLAAVDRSNRAWIEANWSADPAHLNRAMQGEELASSTEKIQELRQSNRARRVSLESFQVVEVRVESPQRAVVTTRERWSSETYELASRRFLSRSNQVTYAETYTVEQLGGEWFVTKNDYEILSQTATMTPPPRPAATPVATPRAQAAPDPAAAVRRHYETATARDYAAHRANLSQRLRDQHSVAAVASWFTNKLGFRTPAIGAVSVNGNQATVEATVETTDRIEGTPTTRTVTERFSLELEGGQWRVDRVDQVRWAS